MVISKKKKVILFIILIAIVVYSIVCFINPEYSEVIARGFSVLFNGILLLLGA